MDINTLYNTIFPLGGIDDNNRYANLTGDKISSVQLVEPSLSVSEFVLSKNILMIRTMFHISMHTGYQWFQ